MEETLHLLQKKGYKLTKQRRLILEALETSAPLSAEKIFSQIHKKCKVNLSTIYRNLNILLKVGIIRKANNMAQADHFELISHHCTHALLCLKCGEKVLFSSCMFDQMVRDIEFQTQYQVKHHNFEVYGLCPKCCLPV